MKKNILLVSILGTISLLSIFIIMKLFTIEPLEKNQIITEKFKIKNVNIDSSKENAFGSVENAFVKYFNVDIKNQGLKRSIYVTNNMDSEIKLDYWCVAYYSQSEYNKKKYSGAYAYIDTKSEKIIEMSIISKTSNISNKNVIDKEEAKNISYEFINKFNLLNNDNKISFIGTVWAGEENCRSAFKDIDNEIILVGVNIISKEINYFRFLDENRVKDMIKKSSVSKPTVIADKDSSVSKNIEENTLYTVFKGENSRKVKIVFFAEGYTSNELEQFIKDVNGNVDYILKQKPFDVLKEYFHIQAYTSVSNQSGTGDGIPIDTVFKSFIGAWDIPMLLSSEESNVLINMKEYVENLDWGIVLVNTDYIGGSGGDFTVSGARGKGSYNKLLHVGMHTFAYLADEGSSNMLKIQYEERRQNISKVSNARFVPWSKFIGYEGIGVYPNENFFKPSQKCRMNDESDDFCLVCQNIINEKILSIVNSTN